MRAWLKGRMVGQPATGLHGRRMLAAAERPQLVPTAVHRWAESVVPGETPGCGVEVDHRDVRRTAEPAADDQAHHLQEDDGVLRLLAESLAVEPRAYVNSPGVDEPVVDFGQTEEPVPAHRTCGHRISASLPAAALIRATEAGPSPGRWF